MVLKLYVDSSTPTVRCVLLLSKAIGLDLDLQEMNLLLGEHFSLDFLQLNPQHTVPTLQDGDFVIWDSHAINAYLVSKYAENDSLYPKDLQKRAVIDQRLHFDSGILYPRFIAIVKPIIRGRARSVPKDKADPLIAGYTSLETLLEKSTYVAGNELSIADFSIVSTISSANIVVPIAENRFPKISAWLNKMKQLPYYEEANQVGLEKYAALIKSKLK